MSKLITINGVELLEENDMVARSFKENEMQFEPESFRVWEEACVSGKMVIDVGAYTGLYSIAAQSLGASVLAFEPNIKVYTRLLENIAHATVESDLECTTIKAYNLALSDEVGTTGFYSKPMHLTSAGHIDQNGHSLVYTRPLDCILGKVHIPVTAIKIDVEGHELKVLQGASMVLQKDRPMVIVECLTEDDEKKVVDFMQSVGYNQYPQKADDRNLIFT